METKVYVALSGEGYPATFIGYHHLRRDLVEDFKAKHGKTPKEKGYRVVKATLVTP